MANKIEELETRITELTKRVKALEADIRPLKELEGINGDLIGDQAVVSFVAEQCGSDIQDVASASRKSEVVAYRRIVAQQLRDKLNWSYSRIARNLNRTEAGIRVLLEQKIG